MRRNYALASILLFAVELTIALYVHDQWVRPFLGDVLVVILLYCGLQTVFLRPPQQMALACLLIACTIETLQAFDFAAYLGANRYPWLSVVLGRTFSPSDYVAYLAGYLCLRQINWWSDGRGRHRKT